MVETIAVRRDAASNVLASTTVGTLGVPLLLIEVTRPRLSYPNPSAAEPSDEPVISLAASNVCVIVLTIVVPFFHFSCVSRSSPSNVNSRTRPLRSAALVTFPAESKTHDRVAESALAQAGVGQAGPEKVAFALVKGR